jgi:hypothetical protein
MTIRITAMPDPPMVEVRLSDAAVERECAGDVIADVNWAGNWIRGLELLGSAGFSLERALAPFDHTQGNFRPLGSGRACCDLRWGGGRGFSVSSLPIPG